MSRAQCAHTSSNDGYHSEDCMHNCMDLLTM